MLTLFLIVKSQTLSKCLSTANRLFTHTVEYQSDIRKWGIDWLKLRIIGLIERSQTTGTNTMVKTVYLINGVGKSGQIDAKKEKKKETRPPFYIIYKNKLKMIKDLNVRLKPIKILEENVSSKISDISLSNIFFRSISQGKGNKRKNKQMGLH